MITTRPMMIADIPNLKLEAEWMYERYAGYLDNKTGPAWVMADEKGPLCAFGVAFLWDGVCEAWFNLIAKRRTITVIRTVKRYLDKQGVIYGVWRFHATIKCGFDLGCRFVEALGFERNPKPLRKYNPDKSDAWLYERVI